MIFFNEFANKNAIRFGIVTIRKKIKKFDAFMRAYPLNKLAGIFNLENWFFAVTQKEIRRTNDIIMTQK